MLDLNILKNNYKKEFIEFWVSKIIAFNFWQNLLVLDLTSYLVIYDKIKNNTTKKFKLVFASFYITLKNITIF